MKLATKRVGRGSDELGGRSVLENATIHDDTDPIGECGRILEVVRDEDRRQRQVVEELA